MSASQVGGIDGSVDLTIQPVAGQEGSLIHTPGTIIFRWLWAWGEKWTPLSVSWQPDKEHGRYQHWEWEARTKSTFRETLMNQDGPGYDFPAAVYDYLGILYEKAAKDVEQYEEQQRQAELAKPQ